MRGWFWLHVIILGLARKTRKSRAKKERKTTPIGRRGGEVWHLGKPQGLTSVGLGGGRGGGLGQSLPSPNWLSGSRTASRLHVFFSGPSCSNDCV